MARPRQISDEDILAVARDCFLEHGPGVSTTVVAEKLGVSQAALFKRFGTKVELMVASLRPPERPPWVAVVEGGPDERPIPEQLLNISQGIVGFSGELLPCFSVLRASGVDLDRLLTSYDLPPPVLGQRALRAWLERAAKKGRIRKTDAGNTALAWMGGLHILPFMSHIAQAEFPLDETEVYLRQLVDLLWRALAPEGT